MSDEKLPAKLLSGTWRSDRARTETQWVFPKRLAAHRRRDFFAIFGHLTVKFSTRHCYWSHKGRRWSCPYKIIWSRNGPVFPQLVLVYTKDDGESAQHIFFDSADSFYVQGGKCAEFFRRVPGVKRKRAQAR